MLLLRIAAANLVAARGRSCLLGTAIVLVTAMLVLLLSLAGGLEDNLVRSATTLSAGHVTVAGFYKAKPTDGTPLVTGADQVQKIIEANTPGMTHLLRRQRGWGKLIGVGGSTQTGLAGVDYSNEGAMFESLRYAPESEYVEDGGPANPGDFSKLASPGSIVLFVSQAKRIGVHVGDTVTFQTETQGGQTNTIDLQVAAVAQDLGLLSTFAVFAAIPDVQELYQLNPDTTGAFWIYLDDIDRAEDVMNHLRVVFEKEGYQLMDHVASPFFFKFDTVMGEDWTGQKLDLTIWSDEVSFLLWILTAFDSLTWTLSLILVAIIALGIMNALYNAVRERTKEIGTLRAIGMGRFQVLGMILLEALLLGLVATTAGAIGASVLAVVIDALHIPIGIQAVRFILLAEDIHLVVRPLAVAMAVVLSTGLTGIAALLPAFRAARLRPVVAMAANE
jgi:putative ABC transport system permease protein